MCSGTSPARASAGFEREFGAREAAVRAALVRLHGEAALARSRHGLCRRASAAATCPTPQWRARYAQLLRVLEIRFGLT